MPLQRCRHCGHEANRSVTTCPDCGEPLPGSKPTGRWVMWLLLVGLAVLLYSRLTVYRDPPIGGRGSLPPVSAPE